MSRKTTYQMTKIAAGPHSRTIKVYSHIPIIHPFGNKPQTIVLFYDTVERHDILMFQVAPNYCLTHKILYENG